MQWIKPFCLSFFKAKPFKKGKIKPRFNLEALEPKVLLSAELLAGSVDAATLFHDNNSDNFSDPDKLSDWARTFASQIDTSASQSYSEINPPSEFALDGLAAFFAEQQNQQQDDLSQMLADAAFSASAANDQPLELIIIDPRTPDYMTLVEGVSTQSGSDYLIYMLDAEKDGVQQVTDLLATHHELEAVHLISHGTEGGIQLGSSWLSSDNLTNYAEQISSWNAVFDEDADILIYGCDLAGNASGEQLLQSLAELTGADVAASTDRTGSQALGGDWDLEYQVGEINTSIAFNSFVVQNWSSTLALPTANDDNALTATDTPIIIDVLANDTDPEGNPISILDFTLPTNGAISINADDFITYTPDNDFNGVDSFQYLLTDDQDDISNYWRLDGNALDAVGTKDGVISGTTTITGHYGQALSFDGINDYVQIPDTSYQTGATTLSFRFMLSDLAGSDVQTLYSHGALGSPESLNIYIGENGHATSSGLLVTNIRDNDDNLDESALDVDISAFENDGLWHSYTLVLQDGVGAEVFIDGISQANAERGSGSLNPSGDVYLGASQDLNAARFYSGAIDSLQLHKVALSDSEITDLHSGGNALASVNVTTSPFAASLVLSTENNVSSPSGAPGLDSWQKSELLAFDPAENGFQSNTSGVFQSLSNLTSFGGDSKIDALHYVTQDMLVGNIQLNEGDVLLSLDVDKDLSSSNFYESLKEDVFRFRPDALGDYASGTFTKVWSNPTGQNITSISLIEGNAYVGSSDTLLNKGSFLFTDSSVKGIQLFNPGDLSVNPTAGSVSLLINGTEEITTGKKIFEDNVVGLEFIEEDVTTGGVLLQAGTILLSVDGNKGIWADNNLAVTGHEIVALNVSATTLSDSATAATASVFFEGTDVGLDINNERIASFSFIQAQGDGNADPTGSVTITGSATEDQTLTVDTSSLGDIDGLGSFSYQWQRDGVAIDGASSSTYTLGDDDVGAVISVVVSYTDGENNAESIESAATSAVSNINDAPTATQLNQTINYSEGVNASLNNIVVNDVDAGDIISARLTLQNPLDGSLTTGTFGLSTSTYSSLTGVWRVTGTVDDVNAALAAVEFNPGLNLDRSSTITTHIEDASGAGPANGVINLNVTTDNDAPTATNLTQLQSYTEGASTVELDDIEVTEFDNNDVITATLTLDNTAAGTLTTGTFGSSTSTYNSSSGVWTVTGSVTDVNAALAAVAFTPNSNNDVNTSISTHIEDAAGEGPTDGTISLNVTAQNDAPTATNLTQVKAYTEGAGSVALDAIVITDVDTSETVTASLTLDNTSAGNLTTGTFGSSTSSYNSSTGIWTVTGTVTDVNAALAAVAFSPNTNNDVNASITTHIEDAAGEGPTDGTISLNVTAQNDAPTATNLTQVKPYTEGASSVALDAIVITDVDSSETVTATLTLDNTSAGVLTTGTFGSSTSTYNSGTGVWTVTGTVTDVNAALAAVAFSPNTNNDVNASITTHIEDAAGEGPTDGTISLNVTAQNDAPTATNLTQVKAYTEGAGSVALDDIVITDVDSSETVTATLTLDNTSAGVLTTGTFGSSTSTYSSGTGVWTVTGTVADVNAALAAVAFTPNTNNDVNASITTHIEDAAGEGPTDGTISLNVTAQNDAPTATNLTQVKAYTEGAGSVALDDIVITDVDSSETVTATLTLDNTSAGVLTTGTFGSSTSTYNSGTGVWTVTGTVADVNAALAAVAFTPNTNNDVNASITTHIEDAAGEGPANGSIALNVTALNDDPSLDSPISNQSATEDSAFSFTFPANTFNDVDTASSLTYSAQLSGGGALPAWLSFNSSTRTFSGTPTNDDVGTITIKLFADDGQGGSPASDTFDIVISNTNDDPFVANSISNQSATEDSLFSFTFAANTFDDVDTGASLSYSAQLSGGGALPAWLSFDDATRTFSGTPLNGDIGSLNIEVIADDSQGGTPAVASFDLLISNTNDLPAGALTIDGTVQEDQILTANTSAISDEDGLGSFDYQWYRNGLAISGATENTYTLVDADVATSISVAITYTDARGELESVTSAGTSPVSNINDNPVGSVDITGTASLGNVLTVSNDISDDDGVGSITYQWQRNGVDIVGETSSSYTLAVADIGNTINVVASYIDLNGTTETVLSAATSTVTAVNNAPTGSVSISGIAQETNTLSVNTSSLADADGLGTFSYQWQRDGINILGATGNSYLLTNDDVGSAITVVVRYTDGLGTAESVVSSATSTITNVNDAPTATQLTQSRSFTEDAVSVALNDIVISDSDVGDSFSATLTLSDTSAGSLSTGTFGLSSSTYNTSTGVWTVSGNLADVNAALAAVSFLPASNQDQTVTITTHIEDLAGSSPADGLITLTAIAVNDDPTLVNALPDQVAAEDSLFSFTFASDAFNDVDTGDTLSYSAQLQSGAALPAWLNFDDATRTFSGTPLNGDVGTLQIKVTADDGKGGTPGSDSFTLTISNTNDSPSGSVIINGLAQEGETLSLDTSSIADEDGLTSFSIQWFRDGVAITGATDTSYTLSNSDVGFKLSASISYVDARGEAESLASLGTATVSNINDAPTATNLVQIKAYTEGAAGVALDDIVVSDMDAGETITARLTLADSAAGSLSTGNFGSLTSTYDSATGIWLAAGSVSEVNSALADVVFIPSLNQDQATSISVHIEDAAGAGPSDGSVVLNVTAINDDPTLEQAIPDQTATEDSAFNFTFAANTFGDVDSGATLTYSAQLVGGAALPAWLSFDADSRTFSGTPLNADVGMLSIEVIADDGQGGTPATDSFDLVIANSNDDPALDQAIPNQAATEDSTFNFSFAPNTFGDVDSGATLTFSAQLVGGTALPSWLSFDADSRTFSGTPLNADVGTLSIEVMADDGQGGTPASDSFDLVIANSNDDPTLDQTIPDQAATEDSAFNFTFAANTFGDVDSGATLTYSAQLVGGTALPSWLSFDADSRTFSGTPLNADVGTLSIEVIAVDGQGGTAASDSFDVVIANSNDDPILDQAIPNQSATEDSAFTFTFAANTFGDVDSGATLTYSAQLVGGGALPSWLSFDADSRTFSGTPLNADVGSLSIEVIADDGQGGTPASDSFDVVIANSNDDPTLDQTIPNQSATEDSAFTFTFAANTFGDVDSGATLTYSAQLVGGTALPSWLSFDDTTRTFSGTPLNADVGTLSIEIIADDGQGGTPASDSFDVVIANSNDDPTLDQAIPNQSATEDSAFTFTFAANTFGDVDSDATLTYSAQLVGGGALPSWLSFDDTTRTFSGTPLNADVGTLSIEIIADDGQGGTPASDSFDVVIANSNDDPTLDQTIPNQSATEDSAFNFTFAANTFGDVDSGATLTYSAQLVGGTALPSWLSFDDTTRTFSGTPLNADVGTLSIEIIADDGQGGTPASDSFDVVIANSNDDPTLDQAIPNQSATEDSAFTFTFAANTFGDVDSDATLTYSAQLVGGGALPSWLSFDDATRTFTGTPLNADVGTLSIEVIADDGQGGTPASDSFDLIILNTNDAPVGQVVINGLLTPGEPLTADTSSISDEDGLGTFAFQWQKNGIDIPGAETAEYIIETADIGQVLSVKVTYLDGGGNTEELNSASVSIAEPIIDQEEAPETIIIEEPVNEEKPTTITKPASPLITEKTQEEQTKEEPEEQDLEEEDTSEESVSEVNDELNDSPIDSGLEEENLDNSLVFYPEATSKNVTGAEKPSVNVAALLNTEKENLESETEESLREKDINFLSSNDPLVLIQTSSFMKGLDNMREDLKKDITLGENVVASSLAVSAGVSAGYVAWLARSGVLLSSVLSSLPMWRFIDPLPILGSADVLAAKDDETLESIISSSDAIEASISELDVDDGAGIEK